MPHLSGIRLLNYASRDTRLAPAGPVQYDSASKHPARAEADPELAVLSAMAHGRGNVDQAVQIALAAIAGAKLIQDRDVSVLYFDLIDAALSEAARKAFQMLPQGYEFQSETLRKNVATTKAAAVVAVLEAREIAPSEEQKNRILACLDIKLLDQWIRRAAIIGSADELFSA